MNKTDLLKQIARAITTAAKGVDPKVKVTTSKVVTGLSAAKLADDLILDKVPGIKNAMIWTDEKITQGQQWLIDNTLGKIPGVGPVISKLHKKGTDVRYKIRDALFGSNHPDWYEHLPQHVEFTIPGSYNNKSVQFITRNGGKTGIPSVATINMVRNIITTPYATASRYSEIYTAVKYARGLSYLSYNVNQMALMFEIGNELSVLYYRVAKAISAAFHYSLTKANLPAKIIEGLEISDAIEHYADYVTLLDQMYNFMSVNVPLLPLMHNKIRQMCLFTALDSGKPALSTYIQACVKSNYIQVYDDDAKFYSGDVYPTRDIAACKQLFQYYMGLLTASQANTTQLLNIIADVKGSISGVTYVDNWRNIKFEGTFTDDKLFLNSIKNMDLLPTFGIVGTAQGSTSGNVCDIFVRARQGSHGDPIDVSKGIVQPIGIRMGAAASVSQGFEANYICCSGSKEIKPFAVSVQGSTSPHFINLTDDQYRFTNRLVTLDGTEDTEGKVLETLSLSHVTASCSYEFPTDTTPSYVEIYVTTSMFVGINITIANGYDDQEVKTLGNFLNVPGWVVDNNVYGAATSWSMVDWMPAIRISQFHDFNTWFSMQLWDINGIGSLSYTAVNTAIDYITYSLLYPGNVEALNKVELANKLISSLKSK